jgi:hypothetical protein
MRASTCRGCMAPIVWAGTVNGKAMPVDVDPRPDGNVRLTEPDGLLRAEVLGPLELMLLDDGERAALRMPHHATCPQVEQFR